MKIKAVSGIILTLLTTSILVVTLNTVPTIAILPVHNIDTGIDYATIQETIDAPETQDGHTITVDAGTYYEHVVVTKSLYLIGEDRGTTIIDGSEAGTVVTIMADNVILSNFTIQNSGEAEPWTPHAEFMNHGVEVFGYNNVTVSNNIFLNNEVGIYEKISHRSSIIGNLVLNNRQGICVHHSMNNTLRNNNMIDNSYHLNVWGAYHLDEYIHDIDTSNIVDGKPVYYWINEADKKAPLGAGYIALINSTNILVENLNVQNTNLLLVFTTESVIRNVTILDAGGFGVIVCSSNNTIVDNLVSDNIIAPFRYLAHMENSFDNLIYHNSFINAISSWRIDPINSINKWDSGYPSGGNYWSDHVTVDDCSGVNQDEPGSDGIVDEPYIIDGANCDHYPLVEPWSPKPPSPQEALEDLIQTVESWDLNTGIETSLTSILQGAYRSLDGENPKASIGQLRAFMSEAEALKDDKLNIEQADYLILEAQRIIDLIKG